MAHIFPIRDQFEKWITMDNSSPEHVLRDTGNLAKALGEIMFRENVLKQSDHQC